jgi:hypothetical protein
LKNGKIAVTDVLNLTEQEFAKPITPTKVAAQKSNEGSGIHNPS